MDNPLDMTKQTLERLEAEASGPEYQGNVAAASENEKNEDAQSRVAFEVLEERRLSSEYNDMREVCNKRVPALVQKKAENDQVEVVVVQEERRVPERRLSIEYEMMPPPPSPAMRPKSATPRREFSQPRFPFLQYRD